MTMTDLSLFLSEIREGVNCDCLAVDLERDFLYLRFIWHGQFWHNEKRYAWSRCLELKSLELMQDSVKTDYTNDIIAEARHHHKIAMENAA